MQLQTKDLDYYRKATELILQKLNSGNESVQNDRAE